VLPLPDYNHSETNNELGSDRGTADDEADAEEGTLDADDPMSRLSSPDPESCGCQMFLSDDNDPVLDMLGDSGIVDESGQYLRDQHDKKLD
jgi:hypothetical protein